MITSDIEYEILPDIESLMIPVDNVASVIGSHSLINALMILSNKKYTTIPVMTPDSKLLGLINMRNIFNECMTYEDFDFDQLSQKRVGDIELLEPQRIKLDTPLEIILSKLVDDNFLCVIDDNEHLLGILTRRTILSQINKLLHSNRLKIQ